MARGADVSGGEFGVGAHVGADRFFAGFIDENQGHAGVSRGSGDPFRLDAFAFQICDGGIAAIVFADAANHCDASAQAGGGDGLVGAFAARALEEFGHNDSFAGVGNALAAQDEIGVNPADNNDVERLLWHGGMMFGESFLGKPAVRGKIINEALRDFSGGAIL